MADHNSGSGEGHPVHADYPYHDEPEQPNGDADSTMGDSIASSTASLTSSVAQYEHEHGRRYHAYQAGRYFMPDDEQEQDLMDITHLISLEVHDGRLFLAPLEAPTSILDVGTGAGIWAIDVADAFPSAHVIGTDLSPIQPTWVPANLQFEVSDCETDWTFHTGFDLIHMRNLSGSINDWPKLLSHAQQHLNHGGWLDMANLDVWIESNNNILPADSALAQWRHLLAEAASQAGRSFGSARLMRDRVMTAGFVRVTEEVFRLPLFPWMQGEKERHIAQLMQYIMTKELEGLSLALFTRVLHWSVQDTQNLLAGVRKDIFNVAHELHCNVYYVYGQKG